MYALAQKVVSGVRSRGVFAARGGSYSKMTKPTKRVSVGGMEARRYCTGMAGQIVKLEGRSALPLKLEDPVFRRDYIANPPLPPGRDIWKDNPRLEIRLGGDPLLYTWPEGQDFSSYDPALKRNWEDEMFELKWFGKAKNHVQGGDWANFRISTAVPPRIKIYYANMVQRYQQGALIAATLVFNNLLTDYLAPRGQIPYGVYHTMLIIYLKRERFSRALDMFNEIVSHHTPTPDDYALGMEVLLRMHAPKEALEVWRSFQIRPSLKPNASMYSMLIKTYSMLGDIAEMANVFMHAEQKAKDPVNKLDFMAVYATMIQTYAHLGFREELLEILDRINSDHPLPIILTAFQALNQVGLHDKVIANFDAWFPHKELLGISHYNELLKAHVGNRNVPEVEKLLQHLSSQKLDLDIHSYTCLIANKFKMAESSLVYQLANDGMALKNVRPSIRNYRAVHGANVLASAPSDYGVTLSTTEDMKQKKIEFDAALLEAATMAQSQHNKLADAVALWREVVVIGKLIPSRKAFTNFFTAAGIERSPLNAALAWKLSQALFIQPDYQFTSSLSLALQPDRNYFGLVETRRQHQHWTSQPQSTRVLDKAQLAEFTRFIDHAISTFAEPEQKLLAKEWKIMFEELSKPRKENLAPAEAEPPRARPVSSETSGHGPLKRLFGSESVPEPGAAATEAATQAAAAAATASEAVDVAAEDAAGIVEDVADAVESASDDMVDLKE